MTTLQEMFENTASRIPDGNFLGTKHKTTSGADPFEYRWCSYGEALTIAQKLARGMLALELVPPVAGENGDFWRFLGLQSKNCAEWYQMHLANFYSGTTTIALYDTLGVEAMKYIINQTEVATVGLSVELAAGMINMKLNDDAGKTSCLANLITFGEVRADVKAQADQAGIRVFTFDQVLEAGNNATMLELNRCKTDDVFMLCYTSGTTGDPKGVKLTHKMFANNCEAATAHFPNAADKFTERDCYISYLPAAHSFEQWLLFFSILVGGQIGFYGGDPRKMTDEDLPYLKPTFFPSVPRLLNVIYGKLKARFEETPGITGMLMRSAIASKLAAIKETGSYTNCFWDRIVFSKISAKFGGRLRLLLSGSAPLSGEVQAFLKCCFACPFPEGYGLTETAGAACAAFSTDGMTGHVGGILACTKVRTRDVPEMGYHYVDPENPNADPKGEICFKGPSIFTGYYKNPEKTAEAFDEEGWFRTGDVGVILPNGAMKIIDRAKNIFKLAQGEYIAPEKLENIYVQSGYIAQICVHGDSLQDYCVAIIVVDPDKLKEYA